MAVVVASAAAAAAAAKMMLPIVLSWQGRWSGYSGVHQSRRVGLGGSARVSVSFSGKRNVSKTYNINSIRLFWVRKAQRRHCANASAVTSRAPKQMAAFSGENLVVGGRRCDGGWGVASERSARDK